MDVETLFCAHTMMWMFDVSVSHRVMEKEFIHRLEFNEWVMWLFMSACFVFWYQFLSEYNIHTHGRLPLCESVCSVLTISTAIYLLSFFFFNHWCKRNSVYCITAQKLTEWQKSNFLSPGEILPEKCPSGKSGEKEICLLNSFSQT